MARLRVNGLEKQIVKSITNLANGSLHKKIGDSKH